MEAGSKFAGAAEVRHRAPILIIVVLMFATATLARDKAVYQTTKLIELTRAGGHWGHAGFCFVVQVDDLAYVAVTDDDVPRNLIVGDPMQIKISGDHIWVKKSNKWGDDEIKTRISVRKRMTGDTKLPTCSLPVAVH
jgi:hypothetical protein